MKRIITTASATLGAAAILALAAPLAASAHVQIVDNTAAPGESALLTFRVPNESATATTNKLEIDMPKNAKIDDVVYQPLAGWTATTTDSSITFTAQGAGIGIGQLQLFSIAVGPIPKVDSLEFVARQTYTDGKVVTWDGSGDDPAPTLYVDAAPPTDEQSGEILKATQSGTNGDVLARVFGIVGLVLGALALVVAAATLRRRTVAE